MDLAGRVAGKRSGVIVVYVGAFLVGVFLIAQNGWLLLRDLRNHGPFPHRLGF